MTFDPVISGNLALATAVQQLIDAWTGVSGAGEPLSLTGLRSTSQWAMTVRNLDATNSRHARFLKSDDPAIVLMSIVDSGVTIRDLTATTATIGTLSLSGRLGIPVGTGALPGLYFIAASNEAGLNSTDGSNISLTTGGSARLTVTDAATTVANALTLSSSTLGYVDFPYISAPSAPSAGLRLYSRTGGGIYVRAASGSERELADLSSAQTLTSKTLTDPILTQSAAAPSAPGASKTALYSLTADGRLYYRPGAAGSSTKVADYSETVTSILTAQGDIAYASGANTVTRLAKGTAFQELTMNSGATAPQWSTGPVALAAAAGDIFYATGANALAKLGIGTTRQALTVNTAANAPQWSSLSSGATIYVAASDATTSEKAVASYLCDGTADDVEILAALAAVPSTGGSVELSSGTFTITSTITFTRSNTELRGQGTNTIIKVANTAGTGGFSTYASHIYINVANFSIRNFKLNSNRANNTNHNTYTGIGMGAAANGVILAENVWIDNFSVYGFSLSSAVVGARIVNCRATTGVDNGYGFLVQDGAQAVALFNCVSSNNTGGGFHSQATRTVFTGCLAYSNTGNGFEAAYGTSIDNRYIGCLAYSNSSGFATISTAVRPSYANCTADNNSAYGFYVALTTNGANLVGNTAHSNSTSVNNGYSNISYNGNHGLIEGNICRVGANANKPSYGIALGGANNFVGINDLYGSGNVSDYIEGGTNTRKMGRVQASVLAGTITGITVTAGGSGYNAAPTVSFSGGGGSGATATAYVDSGAVVYVAVTGAGSGYTSAPTVSFTPVSGGSGAAATAAGGYDTIAPTSGTPTTEQNFGSSHAYPAGTLTSVGKLLKFRAWGTYSTAGSGTVTLRLQLKAGSTTLLDFGTITTAISIASRRWDIEAEAVVQGVGGSGPLEVAGKCRIPTANNDTGFTEVSIGGSVSLDTTSLQTFQISAIHGTGNASGLNTVSLRQFSVIALN